MTVFPSTWSFKGEDVQSVLPWTVICSLQSIWLGICLFVYSFIYLDFLVSLSTKGRELQQTEPLFLVWAIQLPNAFVETILFSTGLHLHSTMLFETGIILKNAFLLDMAKITAHCFRSGGAQHGFVTGKSIWPLDVVKWWVGGGDGDYVNTILRYLLEETLKYEKNRTHFMYTRGSAIRLFNTCVSTLDDISS